MRITDFDKKNYKGRKVYSDMTAYDFMQEAGSIFAKLVLFFAVTNRLK